MGGSAGATDIAYLHTDHLGTPQEMTDAAGQLVWWRDQTPFGQTVAEGGFSQSPLRFAGQYADAESGLHYARQLCELARNAGLKLIGSGLMGAPIGIATSVSTFAAYGIDYPIDLNGPQHLADDYLKTPLPVDGRAELVPDGPGISYETYEARVRGELCLNLALVDPVAVDRSVGGTFVEHSHAYCEGA